MAWKDPKRQNEYRKGRYHNDPEFRKRVREIDNKDKKERYEKGKTWKQQNPEKERLYHKGWRAGVMRARKAVCPCCEWRVDKILGNRKTQDDAK